MKTIAIIGSCDTKYREICYMRELIEAQGVKALVIDVQQDQIRQRDMTFQEKK